MTKEQGPHKLNESLGGQRKQGIIERSAAFFEKLHYGIGAIAIGGALIAPEAIVAPLIIFGAYEIAHGALWNWIKSRSSKRKQPALAPA